MKENDKKIDVFVGAFLVVIFIYLSFMSFPFFEFVEKKVYEIQMRLDTPRNQEQSKVVIVNIDDKSIDTLGKWPWPRNRIAEMITILKNNGAKLIGLDMVFSEREQNLSIKEIQVLRDKIKHSRKLSGSREINEWILTELKDIEKRLDNDTALTETVRNSKCVILPVIGEFGKYETDLVIPPESFLNLSTLKNPHINIKEQKSVNKLAVPFSELAQSSHALAHINVSPNTIMSGQTHIPFINYRGLIFPSMPLRLAIDFRSERLDEAIVEGSLIKLGQKIFPASRGEVLIKFKGGSHSFPYYSFIDILNVKKVPAVFEGKIVLIGFTGKGSFLIDTPVDPYMPRVEFMANAIDAFLNGRFLKRPNYMFYLEILILLFLGLATSFFQSSSSYLNRTAITAGFIFLVFVTSAVFFIAFDMWLKTSYIILALITIYCIIMGKDIVIARKRGFSKDAIETNRMLGISLQSQGLLDLAFEKFRKCPLDDEMRDIIYNLGLDYERKRMTNKAISVYEYINKKEGGFRDLNERIPKLKKLLSSLPFGAQEGKKGGKIAVSDDLEVKPTIGRYEILMELGQGAMGTVYKGRDPKINRLLAIKTIRFSDEFEEDQLEEIKERFFREAELAGKLSNPGIVSIYDVGEDYDLTYMAMEFLDGEDLEKYCKKGSLLPMRKLLDVMVETSDALEYAHNNGVIHRDIKPANIMLLKNGRIKVTDFGIAKSMSSSKTRSGIILGTPNYMAPEQIMGRQIDARSDIFSLGIVFFQLLTGELPFHGENLNSLFYQITQVKHPSPRTINPRVIKPCEQILDKILAKNPDHRFQKAGDLSRYLKILSNKIDALREQKIKNSRLN